MHIYYMKDFTRGNEKICAFKSVYIKDMLPEHTHDFFEITYISCGTGYHFLNGSKNIVKKGDLIFMTYTTRHTFEPITEDFTWINCNFLPEAIDRSLINTHNAEDILKLTLFSDMFQFKTLSLSELSELQVHSAIKEFDSLFNDMVREYSNCKEGYEQVLQYYLLILLIRIFRYNYDSNATGGSLDDNTLVDMVLSYMKDHSLNENLRLEDIAKKAYVSPKYFSTLFKQKTGKNLTEFIQDQKIEKACELLKTTDLPVLEIMNKVGYKDSKFFYCIFKRKTGLTPGAYKNLE